MNPMTSGSLAFSGAVAAKGVLYVFSLARLPAPDPDVAELIAGLIIAGGHAAVTWFNVRFPMKTTTTASVPVEVSTTPVSVSVGAQPATK